MQTILYRYPSLAAGVADVTISLQTAPWWRVRALTLNLINDEGATNPKVSFRLQDPANSEPFWVANAIGMLTEEAGQVMLGINLPSTSTAVSSGARDITFPIPDVWLNRQANLRITAYSVDATTTLGTLMVWLDSDP
jgi:hypothetical protein